MQFELRGLAQDSSDEYDWLLVSVVRCIQAPQYFCLWSDSAELDRYSFITLSGHVDHDISEKFIMTSHNSLQ